MAKWEKFWQKLSGGHADDNIDFDELIAYLERLGWQTSSKGTSHRFYTHKDVPTHALTLQPRRDGKAHPYQVRQVREALHHYRGDNRDGWLRGEGVL